MGRGNSEAMLSRDSEWFGGYQRKRRFLGYCRTLWTTLAGGNKASAWRGRDLVTERERERGRYTTGRGSGKRRGKSKKERLDEQPSMFERYGDAAGGGVQ